MKRRGEVGGIGRKREGVEIKLNTLYPTANLAKVGKRSLCELSLFLIINGSLVTRGERAVSDCSPK